MSTPSLWVSMVRRVLAYIKVNAIADGVEGLQSPILKFLA